MKSETDTLQKPNGWRSVFACDLRSLAAMRIALGGLILVDLAMRARSLTAMYTDEGFFPLSMWHEYVRNLSATTAPLGWSIHALHGGGVFQGFLFIVAAVAGAAAAIGVTPHFSSSCFERSAASATVKLDKSSIILFRSGI